jgi:hypothetical protein
MQHSTSTTTEPAPIMNRLRSVLSAPASEPLQGRAENENAREEEEEEEKYSTSPSPHPAQRVRPVIPLPSGSSHVERSSVFDRLGRARGSMGTSRAEIEDKYSSDSASDKDGYDMVEYSVAQVLYPVLQNFLLFLCYYAIWVVADIFWALLAGKRGWSCEQGSTSSSNKSHWE